MIFLALALLLLAQWWLAGNGVVELPYSRFLALMRSGGIAEATVTESRIEGRLVSPVGSSDRFVTVRVDDALARELEDAGVDFSGASDVGWFATLLSWILPMVVFIGLWLVVLRFLGQRQGLGGLMSVGKSRAKVYVESSTGVTFGDVAGVDEAKAELMEVVAFLRDRERYGRLGAHVPKGILLVGPPGTGKTLLARAVAGEAGVPFFSISGSEFVEMFVGVGAARVRDLFEQARKAAPCIIFIDELDALGRARTAMGGLGGLDEKEQTLNQLLAELDGFDPRTGIVLLAATNRPEILDPALLRAGRFDRQVALDRPDQKGRHAILDVHLKKVKLAPEVEADAIASLTPGFTGADLANLVNEAAIIATRHDRAGVTMEDFVAAVERIVAGSEMKSRVLKPSDRRRVAYHELGHALVAAVLPSADPVQRVSIIPRSIGALGYTLQRPTEDRFLITAGELQDRLALLLAGRAAEALMLGQISTGAADDLAKATDVARQFVTRFGMSETVGQAVLEEQRAAYLGDHGVGVQRRDYSEATAREVDLAVRSLLNEAFERASRILENRRSDLEAGAALLLERETITPEDFPALHRADPVSDADDRPSAR